MINVVLVDGNNLMFRSYYATAYNGNMMRNSKDFPTNALYGFTTMINKIIAEEEPSYIAVAFDIGKNFRKQEFDFYKVFENNDNMDVIESLVFTKEVNDTTFVTKPIVADSKGGFNFPMWLLWVLLAIVAIIILYFILLIMKNWK